MFMSCRWVWVSKLSQSHQGERIGGFDTAGLEQAQRNPAASPPESAVHPLTAQTAANPKMVWSPIARAFRQHRQVGHPPVARRTSGSYRQTSARQIPPGRCLVLQVHIHPTFFAEAAQRYFGQFTTKRLPGTRHLAPRRAVPDPNDMAARPVYLLAGVGVELINSINSREK